MKKSLTLWWIVVLVIFAIVNPYPIDLSPSDILLPFVIVALIILNIKLNDLLSKKKR